jgi:hypothetical protein
VAEWDLTWTILQLGRPPFTGDTVSENKCWAVTRAEDLGVGNVVADTRYNLVFGIVAGQREFYKGLLW